MRPCEQSSFIYISSSGWTFFNGKGKISACVSKVLQFGFPLLGGLGQIVRDSVNSPSSQNGLEGSCSSAPHTGALLSPTFAFAGGK